jgi:hypothetical protein
MTNSSVGFTSISSQAAGRLRGGGSGEEGADEARAMTRMAISLSIRGRSYANVMI